MINAALAYLIEVHLPVKLAPFQNIITGLPPMKPLKEENSRCLLLLSNFCESFGSVFEVFVEAQGRLYPQGVRAVARGRAGRDFKVT